MTEQVDPEIESNGTSSMQFAGWTRFTAIVTPFAAIFIMLGEASDATFLIRDATLETMALFSNSQDYELLGKIHVGNTVTYVESFLGDPQVSRALADGVTANYFYADNYLVTTFDNEDRIAAYVVVSLDGSFHPEVELGTGGMKPLGAFQFSDSGRPRKASFVDVTRMSNYYLESQESGPSGRFVDIYLGSISYGAGETDAALSDYYTAHINEDLPAEAKLLAGLRDRTIPNLYGEGELPLELIRASLLTKAEFANYFD